MNFFQNKTRFLYIFIQLIILSFPQYSCSNNKRFDTKTDYSSLVSLFIEFREFQLPPMIDDVPDYSKNTMELQYKDLKIFQKNLAAIDTAGWPITKQVDYHLVRAEMNGLDFHHRVLKPWSRDPCFYSIRPGMTDPFDIQGVLPEPGLFPLSDNDLDILNEKLVKVPRIYSQAVQNLYNPAKDLTSLAIHFTKEDVMLLDDLTNNLKEYHPTLLLVAKNARDAVQNYLDI